MSDLSLAEELGQAIDAAGTTDTGAAAPDTGASTPAAGDASAAPAAPAPAAEPAAPVADSRARDASGRFAAKDSAPAAPQGSGVPSGQSPAPAPAAEPAQPGQPQAPADAAPLTWTAAAKSEYANLSPVIKAEIQKRENDFRRGIEQYKQAAQTGSEIMQAVGQDAQMLAQQYGSVGRGIRELLNLSGYASRDPVGFIQWFAQQRGVNLGQQAPVDTASGQLTPQQLAPVVQQLVQPVMQRMSQFENQFLTAQQRAEQQQQHETQSQIEAFRTAADEKGTPRHPYFDDVRGLMSTLIGNGEAQTLDQAYEMACRAHPVVSTAIAAEQQRAADAKRLEDARRAAEDAKRANAANVTGQGAVGMADTSKISLRDELAAHFDGRV